MHAELRAFSTRTPATRWTRIAALFADEMAQVDVLRWALQRSGAESVRFQQRIAELEEALSKSTEKSEELEATVQLLKDERTQQQRRQRELETLLTGSTSRIAELEKELEALKSIDMSRVP